MEVLYRDKDAINISNSILEEVLPYLSYFSNKENNFGKKCKIENNDSEIRIFEKIASKLFPKEKKSNSDEYVNYSNHVLDFVSILFKSGLLVRTEDMEAWGEGIALLHKPHLIKNVDMLTLRLLFGLIMSRSIVYMDYLLSSINKGVILAILERLQELYIEKNIKENGIVKDFYELGVVKKITPYNGGKIDGVVKEYYDNGKIKGTTQFNNGLENGPSKSYYENGIVLRELEYKNGQRVGTCKRYYESGELWDIQHFKDGFQNGKYIEYYPNGNIKSKGNNQNAFLVGDYTRYYESGKVSSVDELYDMGLLLSRTEFYENGNKKSFSKFLGTPLDYDYIEYYEDGSKKLLGSYSNGEATGIWTSFDKEGNIIDKKVFD